MNRLHLLRELFASLPSMKADHMTAITDQGEVLRTDFDEPLTMLEMLDVMIEAEAVTPQADGTFRSRAIGLPTYQGNGND